ncbi:hypothetical protein COV42_02615 [Candidatus Campbellbacteria bacterium CG11_big_fil_rev_8_21_14_0_20_44_21]|uniref:Phosphoribosyltransferase domain-containing protein n=1 Tax=Candidatus Campbellbacteria bacterium CG22_combo_CG10-13_8_21_14_all_43_18 TaxID=1974530 RepID=A0A2H0DXI9_9BACT|nr:MAG: hypothetical protein COW82_00690 [Candidatus Campbellbacteria bacterium CG22_combo_CG10-13_8_21_14_all_43_18]PIR24113.1 MAG: hypothetical protein COV42_02615 [Candidatus Campbellbacteria bacterium CG11_big_fil_rev_8_21_14_0_20_44_21]
MKIFLEIWKVVLEILFPSGRVERKVREMSLDDFLSLKRADFDEKNGVWSLFSYGNPLVREALWQMKYRGSKKITGIFAEVIEEFLLEELSDLVLFENFERPVLVPIPMSQKEKWERGFNQSEMLVKEMMKIGKETHNCDLRALQKIKNTKRQVEVKRHERKQNVSGVFRAGKNLKGRNIILIDDVHTTGSTLNEAGKILKKAGAKKIFKLTLAH